MKFLHLSLLSCAFALGGSLAFGQTAKTVERGTVLNLQGGTSAGKYQWQVSSDGETFIDLPNATKKDLNVKVNAPAYYRVEKSDGNKSVSYGDVTHVALTDVNYTGTTSVTSGAHGFVENKNGMPGNGISIPEDRNGNLAVATKSLTKWTNGDAVAVYYVNHPKDVVDTKMDINVKAGTQADFRLSVYDPNNLDASLATTYITVKGTGELQQVFLAGLNFPHKGYYRYALECLNGWQNITAIEKLYHDSPSGEKSYKSAYLSSPSVHLNTWRSADPNAPKGAVYDWCYQEVMMPEDSDVPGTYIMSLGVLDGYMGIQMNGYMPDGKARHDVIFSMWDKGNADIDPNLAEHLRASVLDKNPLAVAESFGNEGTGKKTFMAGHFWECGKFVQFITNCRSEIGTYTVIENGKEVTKEQENTLVSAWFNAQDGKGWQYISTLRLPKSHKRFDSWYSFLENYDYTSGQIVRKGFYRNGYACASEGGSPKWYHFNKVGFGHTDGGTEEGKRNDYGQGTTSLHQGENGEGAFFMITGGFLDKNITSDEVHLNTNNVAVDTINLALLLDRVDQAIAHEKYIKVQNEYLSSRIMDKTDFRVVDYSSEEIGGEGNNGKAELIVDGNKDTYWHSKWTSGGSKCPHHITVDLAEEKIIDAVEISMSGGSNRYMQAFNLYVSSDDVEKGSRTWTKIYSTNDAPNQETFKVVLDKQAKGRFLKIEITKSRANDGDHSRINEIEVYGEAVAATFLNKDGWSVIEYSSEETTGEGANGRAAQIIDGDVDTYWHSAWQSGTAKVPHMFIVDMKSVNLLEGMQISMSGGSSRYIKDFNLYASVDKLQWKKVYSNTDAPNEQTFKFDLPASVKARFFKIEILSSRDANGVHTRVNEVEMLGRSLSPNEQMIVEAEQFLSNPDAHKVGSPADVYYYKLQSAYNHLSNSINGVEEGANMMKALELYKTTNEINLPKHNLIYTLTSEGRGCMMADAKNNKFQSTKHSSTNVKADYKDIKQQFVFVNKEGKLYLYNCFLKKYMTAQPDVLSTEPQNPIYLVKHPGYKGRVFMKFDNAHNVNFGGSNQLLIDGWGTPDAGNAFAVEEVGLMADMKSSFGALKEKRVATFSAPYAVVAEEGANVYYATEDVENSAILLHLVSVGETIPASSGVLVASDGLSQVRFVKSETDFASANFADNILQSSAFASVIMGQGDYILTKPKNKDLAFYKAKLGSKLAQYRSYLHLSTPASAIRMVYVDGDITGIDDPVFIRPNKSPIYDLSGRVVKSVVKSGVYIQNGKKFIVK